MDGILDEPSTHFDIIKKYYPHFYFKQAKNRERKSKKRTALCCVLLCCSVLRFAVLCWAELSWAVLSSFSVAARCSACSSVIVF